MKLTVALIAGLFAVSASAESIVGYTQARVLSVVPITVKSYRTIPRQSCTVIEEHRQNGSDAVVGAIVGGAIGRNMAKDKDAGTVVGALAGAAIAGVPQTHQSCTTYHDREYFERVTGYNVTFEYGGQLRSGRMDRDPGNTVTIKTVTRVYLAD